MSILNDVQALRAHYRQRRDWYLSAIERTERDIQLAWNRYFVIKTTNNNLSKYDLKEAGEAFYLLRDGLRYFREQLVITEKRLKDLDKEEYSLIKGSDKPIN